MVGISNQSVPEMAIENTVDWLISMGCELDSSPSKF